MGLIQGRPTLDEVLARQQASARGRFIASRLLRASTLLQLLEFVDDVIPSGNSGRIVYPYRRKNVARVAQLRAYYTDYVPRYTTGEEDAFSILRPMGDAFETDRVFRRVEADWIQEQIDGMAPAIRNLFTDMMINGNPGANALEFEGLSELLAGTSQEIDGTGMDFSAGSALTDRQNREMIGSIRREINTLRALGLTPVLIGNGDLLHRIGMTAEHMGFRSTVPDQFGINQIEQINGAYMVDSGLVNRITGPADPVTRVVPTEQAEVIPTEGGVTDLYLVGISRTNGFAGVTLDGSAGVEPIQYETARNDSGVLRRFEAEFVGGVALLDKKAAVVWRNLKVA